MFCTILNLVYVFNKIENYQGKRVKGNIRINPLRFASNEGKFEIISFTLGGKKVVCMEMSEGKDEGEVGSGKMKCKGKKSALSKNLWS